MPIEAAAEPLDPEAPYRPLIEISPVGVFHADAQGHCLYVSEQWCAMAGVSRNEALGTGWVDSIHSDDRDRVAESWYRAAESGVSSFGIEFRLVPPDGEVVRVLGQAVAETGDDGSVLGYVGTLTDITDLPSDAAVKEREARVGLLTDTAPVGILYADVEGNCTYMNRRMREIVRMTRDDFAKANWASSRLHPADRERVVAEWRLSVAESRDFRLDYRVRTEAGEVVWVMGQASASREPDGTVSGYVATVIDITDLMTYRRRGDDEGGLSSDKLRAVIEYIHSRLADSLSLDELAEVVDLSTNHFAREFRKATGVPPHQYVIWRRVELTKQLLRTTDLSIADIASAAGFSTQSHLTSVFHRLAGSTPQGYRAASRE